METAGSWTAPALERRDFRSWEEFFSYVEEYQQRTYQVCLLCV